MTDLDDLIETTESTPETFGESPYEDVRTSPGMRKGGQIALGATAWVLATFIGLFGTAVAADPIPGLIGFAFAVIIPTGIARFVFKWTRFELGLVIGLGICIGMCLLGFGILFAICAVEGGGIH